jgi:hypothetical protein
MRFSSRQAALPDESACVEGKVFFAFVRLLSYQCGRWWEFIYIRDPLFAEEPEFAEGPAQLSFSVGASQKGAP